MNYIYKNALMALDRFITTDMLNRMSVEERADVLTALRQLQLEYERLSSLSYVW